MHLQKIYNLLKKNKKIDNLKTNNKYILYFINSYNKDISYYELKKKSVFYYLKDNLENNSIKTLLTINLKLNNVDLELALDLEMKGGDIFYLDQIYNNENIKTVFLEKVSFLSKISRKNLFFTIFIGLILFCFFYLNLIKNSTDYNNNIKDNIITNTKNNDTKIGPSFTEKIDQSNITKFSLSEEELKKEKKETENLLNDEYYNLEGKTFDAGYFITSKNYSYDIINNFKNINGKKEDSDIIIKTNKNSVIVIPYGYRLSYVDKNTSLTIDKNFIINSKNIIPYEYGISKININDGFFEEIQIYGSNKVFLSYKSTYNPNPPNYSIPESIKYEIIEILNKNNGDKEKTLIYFFEYIKSKKYSLNQKRGKINDPNYIEYIYNNESLFCTTSSDLLYVISRYLGFESSYVYGYLNIQNKKQSNLDYIGGVGHVWLEIKINDKKYFFDPTPSGDNISGIDFGTEYNEDFSQNNLSNTHEQDFIAKRIGKLYNSSGNNIESDKQTFYEEINKNPHLFNIVIEQDKIKSDISFFNFFIDKQTFSEDYINTNKNIFQNITLKDNFIENGIVDTNISALKYINNPIPERYKEIFTTRDYNLISYNYITGIILSLIILLILSIFFTIFLMFISHKLKISITLCFFLFCTSFIGVIFLLELSSINYGGIEFILLLLIIISILFFISYFIHLRKLLIQFNKKKLYFILLCFIIPLIVFHLYLISLTFLNNNEILLDIIIKYLLSFLNSINNLTIYNYNNYHILFSNEAEIVLFILIFLILLIIHLYLIGREINNGLIVKNQKIYDKFSNDIFLKNQIEISKISTYFILVVIPPPDRSQNFLGTYLKKISYKNKVNYLITNLSNNLTYNIDDNFKTSFKLFKISYKIKKIECSDILDLNEIKLKLLNSIRTKSNSNENEFSGFSSDNLNYINKIDIKKSLRYSQDIYKIFSKNNYTDGINVLIDINMIFSDIFLNTIAVLPENIKIKNLFVIENEEFILYGKNITNKKILINEIIKIFQIKFNSHEYKIYSFKGVSSDIKQLQVKLEITSNAIKAQQKSCINFKLLQSKYYFIGIINKNYG